MKTKRIYVAVPIIVSEDGHCSNNCEYHFGRACDLSGEDWDELGDNKRFPACRAAGRRMGKMLAEAVEEGYTRWYRRTEPKLKKHECSPLCSTLVQPLGADEGTCLTCGRKWNLQEWKKAEIAAKKAKKPRIMSEMQEHQMLHAKPKKRGRAK